MSTFFQVEREDHGEWMCLVNDNKEFNAVKEFVRLEVSLEAFSLLRLLNLNLTSNLYLHN